MRVMVLTLDRSQARQEAMVRNLGSLGVAFSFFKGFDGARGEHEALSRYDEAACLRSFGAPLTVGEIACFASHYSLWRECRTADQPLLIMEDDVTLSPGFPRAIEVANAQIARHRCLR